MNQQTLWTIISTVVAVVAPKFVDMYMPDKKKIILITIPDFSVTPQGIMYLSGDSIREIEEFNTLIKAEGQKRDLQVIDIFELTKAMGKDTSLVTADGLHPSAKELKLWEQKIFPIAKALLKA